METLADRLDQVLWLLGLMTTVASSIAAYVGVNNRRELRNGIGVVKGSKRRARGVDPELDKLDELPLRALVETSLRYQGGIDSRLERVERHLDLKHDEDVLARAGELERREGEHGT